MKLNPFKDPYEAFGENTKKPASFSSDRVPSYEEVKSAMMFKRLLIGVPCSIVLGLVVWLLIALGPAVWTFVMWAAIIFGGMVGFGLGVNYLIDAGINHQSTLQNARKYGVKGD